MKLLLIDNYDSFTYNLLQYLGELGLSTKKDIKLIYNNELSLEQIQEKNPQSILISPGPCTPNEAGVCIDLVKHYWGKVPIFGVCLGLQTIVQATGGKIIKAPNVMHGKVSSINHDAKGIFNGIKTPVSMTRYHSLIAEEASLPKCLEITARVAGSGEIMAIRGKSEQMIEAVQFHPESILSEHGHKILQNFINHIP